MVIGLNLGQSRWTAAIYGSGRFDDLDRATCRAGKREREHAAKGFRAFTHVLWQHDATPDELLQKALNQLNPAGRGPPL